MRAEWPHRKILTLIARDARDAPAMVSVVPNYIFFSVSNFRYYALRDGLSLRWARAWDEEPIGVQYMILKNGDQGPEWTAARPRRIAERLAGDPNLARVFPVIGEFPLPDGSTATVRARRVGIGPPVALATFGRRLEQAIRRSLSSVARASSSTRSTRPSRARSSVVTLRISRPSMSRATGERRRRIACSSRRPKVESATAGPVPTRRARTVAVEPSGNGNSPMTGKTRARLRSRARRSAIRRGLPAVHSGPRSPSLMIM